MIDPLYLVSFAQSWRHYKQSALVGVVVLEGEVRELHKTKARGNPKATCELFRLLGGTECAYQKTEHDVSSNNRAATLRRMKANQSWRRREWNSLSRLRLNAILSNSEAS